MPVKPHFESSSQWVLSGAGGSVCAARTSYSCVRRRSSIDSRNWRSGLASSGASAASLRSSSISSCDSSSALRPTFAALPSDRNDDARGLGERAELGERLLEVRRGLLEVAQQRRLLVGQLAELRHRRLQLVEEGREELELPRELGAPRGA